VRPRHVWLIATSALEDLEDSACALQLKRFLQIAEAADLDKADLKELFPSGRGLYGGCWQSGSAGSLRHNLAVKGGPHSPPNYLCFHVVLSHSHTTFIRNQSFSLLSCPVPSRLLQRLSPLFGHMLGLQNHEDSLPSRWSSQHCRNHSAKMSTYLVASAARSFRPIVSRYSPPPSLNASLGCLMADSSSKSTESTQDVSALSSAVAGGTAPSATFAKPSNPPKRSSSRRESSNESSPRLGKRSRPNPPPMTAAAALQDIQRADKSQAPSTETSPNPARQALSTLMGSDKSATSGLQDGPLEPATTISEPLNVVARHIQEKPTDVHTDSPVQTSPVSLSSIGTLESNVALSGIETTTVDSPHSVGDVSHEAEASPEKPSQEPSSAEEGPKSFSYPGPMPSSHLQPNRVMSLPGPESRNPERTSSNKKHRCPYCATEFTRHHNLKSHLLTHSHEKPYVCQTCQSRFRRLHDLKRHTKLHTGERPHICPKCGRKFARGDALARHNKGPGGCAGRRGSTDSFGGDEDYDGVNDESMEGLVYGEPEAMDEDEPSSERQSVPSIRRQGPPSSAIRGQAAEQGSFHSRQPNTYPPIQGRPPGGIAAGLYPPQGVPGASGPSTSKLSQTGATSYPPAPGSSSNLHPAGSGASIFPPGSMTESPKPLSPGAPHGAHKEGGPFRNRSPSMSAQFQPQPYGRGSGRRSPPPTAMGAPPSATAHLPPPHPMGLNPPDSRYTLPSQGPAHPPTGPTGPPTHMSGGGLSSHSNSLSSHGQSAKGSGENSAAIFSPRDDRLWAYMKSLEERVNGLQSEVASLKDQLAAANQSKPR
jgi:hypothetical protein